MNFLANVARSKGDPKIVSSGPSVRTPADRMARALGWFSIGLGTVELLAARRLTRALGMRGREGLIRVFGVREIMAGVMSLSVDKQAGLKSRIAGDGLDILALLAALRFDNPRKGNVVLALLMVGAVTMLDVRSAQDLAVQHDPKRGRRRLYPDRSGFPKGIAMAKGAARRLPSRAAAS
ncbi:hypothetical protein [Bradyrhizobium sp.]|uniref:hypothetical protein n=1 Tax=Bradyrhizobium sp. TaxID=376 RepID=UPI001D5EFD0C|nr:hypothetical protein [Bradyrhizobium sp.]MBV8696880.1 hypothetical protein [Bradyrhizobium sp.]MBV8919167.1 hypothetical protein [Bradyrhizobium sp.]MBV9980925.1 hypothetical protein [Bradyrhizobium sp.]